MDTGQSDSIRPVFTPTLDNVVKDQSPGQTYPPPIRIVLCPPEIPIEQKSCPVIPRYGSRRPETRPLSHLLSHQKSTSLQFVHCLKKNKNKREVYSPRPRKMSSAIIKCKGAVAWGPGEPLVMEEVEVDPPKEIEIRIKIVCTSICRSDVNQWENKAQSEIFPRIFGHEASGIVESVGEGVTEFQPGDHVLTVFIGECKTCKHCVSNKSNMCQKLGLERKGVMHSDQKTRFTVRGKPVYHYCAVSSFSEYTVVNAGCAVKIGADVPLDRVCLLSCGVSAGLGAAWKVADITEGSTVVIFGLGTLGLSVAQGAKSRGASRIIGVDINPEKFEKGKAFGVTDFINPNESSQPIQQVIKELTNGGADYSFECVGDTQVVSTALQSCSDGWGVTVTLGVPKSNPNITTHYGMLLSGKTLKGSLFGGWRPKSDLPFLVDKYTHNEIQVNELVTHDMPFDRINEALNLMRDGKCLRCVIHMEK
ncbi:hypothetical protein LUZ60_016591 [Juncus effusus]|nr:hypothetical protein LUZ60_016591 [Juncus effusus]